MKKRIFAIWLAIVMVVMTVVPAMAETKETNTGWQKLAEDTWIYLDANHNRVTNTMRKSGLYYYWLDEDGILVTHGNEGKEVVCEGIHFYLSDNGVVRSEGWDDNGKEYNLKDLVKWQVDAGWYSVRNRNNDKFGWVYYNDNGKSDSGRRDIDGYQYYFVESTDVADGEPTGVIKMADRGKLVDGYYIQQDYSIAVSRWIPIKGQWYYFDEKGQYDEGKKELSFETLDIDSIVLKDVPKEAVVGNSIEIPFEIMVKVSGDTEQSSPSNAAKASSSNAESNYIIKEVDDYSVFEQAYDVNHTYRVNVGITNSKYDEDKSHLRPEISTKFEIDWERQVIRIPISYYGCVFGNLEINGVKSNDFAIVCQYAVSGDNGNTAGAENVEGILNAFGSADNALSVDEAVEALKSVNGLKKSFEALLNDDNVDIEEKLWALEFANNMQKGITASSQVDQNASDLLGGKDVKVVGLGLNAEEDDSTITLKVAVSQEAVPAEFSTGYRTVPMDLSVICNGEAKKQLKIPAVITFPVPSGINGDELELYHIHNGRKEEIIPRYNSGEETVTFVADEYSMFLFVQKLNAAGNTTGSSGGSHGGGGSKSTTASVGSWVQDAIGWWFKKSDGSYPYNCWSELVYNGTSAWYHFSAEGYMQTGWFTDTDGRIYYLNPVSDGTQGAMITGWKQIDGYWYYFNEISDGYKGALLVNTVTPDGYQVDGQGRWVQ